ncbi:MAG: hypothetical protein KBB86_00130 [Candidatus Pacebacteria bacterium]|nr:hypothetical protein [Candidatus Paceibacterota bacterium]
MKKIFNKNLKFVTIFSIVFLALFVFGGHRVLAQFNTANDPFFDPLNDTKKPVDLKLTNTNTPPTGGNPTGGAGGNPAQGGAGGPGTEKSGLQITLTNPLKSNSLEDFIQIVLGVILKFLIPILAILFMYTGFKLIIAKGEPAALKAAKQDFLNLVIGSVLILGAWTFGNIIMNTLKEVGILN